MYPGQARISQGPGELKKSSILLILVIDFATDFATTGKVFQSSFLYTCSDTEGAFKITLHHPATKAGKTAIDGHGAVIAVQEDVHSRSIQTQEIFKDPRGFTYKSVRFCDLDRICDK
jgi:hypothetical protein